MPQDNHTPLSLDGTTYRLVYDFEHLCRVEEATGINLLFSIDWNRVDAKRIRALLWSLLLKEHPDVKLEDLTKYMTFAYADLIQTALFVTLLKANIEIDKAPEETPQEVAA
jgi:hypothetical protein